MRSVLAAISVCGALLGFSPVASAGALRFEKDLVYIVAAPGSGKVSASFPVTNTGSTPVKIQNLKTSCGCTAATAEKQVLGPGEKGEVVVTYDTDGRHGLKETPVTIVTDEAGAEPAIIRLRVLIQQIVELQPSFLMWAEGEALSPKKIAVKVTEGISLTELKVSSGDADLGVRVETVKKGAEYAIWVTPPANKAVKTTLQIVPEYGTGEAKAVVAHIRVR